jgi:hypothetical protein
LYEVSIIPCESEEFVNFLDVDGWFPLLNLVNLHLLHMDFSWFDDNSQIIFLRLFECAFGGFEV